VTRRTAVTLLPLLAVAAMTLIVARRQPEWALVDSAGALSVEIAAGLVLAVAGAVVIARGPDRRSGALLGGAAAAWLVAEWDNPGAPSAILFTLGMALGMAAPALLAHALLVHGSSRLGTMAARMAVGGAYAGLAVLAGIGSTLVTDPGASGCSSCPRNMLRVVDAPDAVAWLERWGLRVGAAALAGAAVLVGWRLWRASPAARRTIAPVLLPGVAFLGLVVAQLVHDLVRGWIGIDHLDQTLRLAEGVALVAVALGVGWQRVAARRIRGRLAGLVVEIAGAARPEGLRQLIAAALDDPTLELLYPFEGGWIDPAGRQEALPSSEARGRTSLVQDDEVVAILIHRPGLLDDAQLVEELGRAARLAIDHERLQAQQRAHLERLRAARTAIVAAADAERRRLERDLHDGAQQALAGLAMAIGIARGRARDEHAERMALAQHHVRAALDGVRALAHATYPAALDEAGLAAALDVLSDWQANVELGALPEGRLDRALEASAYFIVAALTRTDGDALVDVDVHHEPAHLVIDVRAGARPELTEVEDRVGAISGRLAVDETLTGDIHVRVELPCA
jgi:signal transduction histidine kinase